MAGINVFLVCLPLLALSAAQSCNQVCGSGGNSITTRIINGVQAAKCDWGWLVSLRVIQNKVTANVSDPSQTDNICNRQNFIASPATRHWGAGVIVGDRWVLTSARGLYAGVSPVGTPDIPSSYAIVAGEYDVSMGELLVSGEPQEQIKFIDQVFFQDPNYPTRAQNDPVGTLSGNSLALLKLKKPFTMNECVRTVCLPQSDPGDCVKKNCYIAGWGFDLSPTVAPNTLRQAQFNFHSTEVCGIINQYTNGQPLQPGVRCASQIVKGSATCVGDQGGALVCQEGAVGSKQWFLYGTVLIDTVCNGTAGPTQVSDVAAAYAWITSTIASN